MYVNRKSHIHVMTLVDSLATKICLRRRKKTIQQTSMKDIWTNNMIVRCRIKIVPILLKRWQHWCYVQFPIIPVFGRCSGWHYFYNYMHIHSPYMTLMHTTWAERCCVTKRKWRILLWYHRMYDIEITSIHYKKKSDWKYQHTYLGGGQRWSSRPLS